MLGQTIGSYMLTAKLGEGGMGAVFRGEHKVLGRAAAIKVLLPEYSNHREVVQRFFNEARATTAIKHPGIVEVFDFGHHSDGSAYIVMELLAGEPLSHRLHRDKKLPHPLAVSIIAQVASALGAAHATGIIHRDLKPDNIYVVPDPLVAMGTRIKLLDFGIAKLSHDLRGELEATRAGAVLGTPPYMAPEQCVGSTEVDHRADMYALGCLLFHCLCGRPPFISQHFAQISLEHLRTPPPKPRELEPSVPEHIERITLRLLEKEPKNRFQSCDELVAALEGQARPATPVPDVPSAPIASPFAPTHPGNAPVATSRKRTALLGEPLPPMQPAKTPAPQPTQVAASRKKTALMGQPLPEMMPPPPREQKEITAPVLPGVTPRRKTAILPEAQHPGAPMYPAAQSPSQPVAAPHQVTPAPSQPVAAPQPVAPSPSQPNAHQPIGLERPAMPSTAETSTAFLLPLIAVGVVALVGIIALLLMR